MKRSNVAKKNVLVIPCRPFQVNLALKTIPYRRSGKNNNNKLFGWTMVVNKITQSSIGLFLTRKNSCFFMIYVNSK